MRTSTRSALQLAAITVSAAGVLGLLSTGAANAAPASVTAGLHEGTLLAGAPCIVTGYSAHALEEMARDSIGTDTVEDIVYRTCSKAVKQKNGNYKYTTASIVVVCNPQGRVVTAWRR